MGDNTNTDRAIPVLVHGLVDVVAVSAGSTHTVAVKADRTVWSWGQNFAGQLGDNSTTNRRVPVQVPGLAGVVAASAGFVHSVAVKSDGTVWQWGDDYYGQLGDNNRIDELAPVQVPGLTSVVDVSAGGFHTVAVKSDGTVLAWGSNGVGQLGDNSRDDQLAPVQVSGLTGLVGVSAGGSHTVAVKSDGTALAWGSNGYGELGNNSRIDQLTPIQVHGLAGVIAVSAGGYHTVALKSDGAVSAWGNNSAGQLGDNSRTDRLTPVHVPGLTGVVAVSAGSSHTVALKSDGTVWTWGSNGLGELGDNSRIGKLAPVLVHGLTGVIAVSAGGGHTAALKSDGTVWTWGRNSEGQLGDNSTAGRLTPVQAHGLTSVIAVSAGGLHTVALKSDGTVWTWGYNANGQLGDNTGSQRLIPVQVPDLTGVASVVSTSYHTVATKSDGTVWAWGSNFYGQLGDNSRISFGGRAVPVQVPELTGVVAASAGGGHTVALKSGGSAWAWGLGMHGQLGIDRPTITQVVDSVTGGFFNVGTAPPPPPPPPPSLTKIIFLHGLMGSRLHACEQGSSDWVEKKVWPTTVASDYQRLKLPDPASRKIYVGSLLGAAPDLGDGDDLPFFEVYKRFELYMLDGFSNFEVLTYDWRMSLDNILNKGNLVWNPAAGCANAGITDSSDPRFETTRGMLDRVKEIMGPSGKLTIIAHSNGGLLAKRLIQRLEADAAYAGRVDKLIFVAVPHYGAPQAIAQAMHGTHFPFNFASPSLLREVAQSMPVAYQLLPSPGYFGSGPLANQPMPTVAGYLGLLAKSQIDRDLGENHPNAMVDSFSEFRSFATTLDPYNCKPQIGGSPTFCSSAPKAVDATLLGEAIALHAGPSVPPPGGIEGFVAPVGTKVYQVVGTGLPTPAAISYSRVSSMFAMPFLSVDVLESTYGDGTVPYRSALAVEGAQTFVVRLDNCGGGYDLGNLLQYDHANILELANLRALIGRIIRDQPTDASSLQENFAREERCIDPVGVVTASAPPPPVNGVDILWAELKSPADLHVYNATGAHTGRRSTPVPSDQFEFPEAMIPGSTFAFPHRVSLLTRGGPYRFEVRGNGTGVASLIIERRVDDLVTSKVVYPDFQVTPRTVAQVSMSTPDELPTLNVDTDGDGNTDVVVAPAPTRPPIALAEGPTVARFGSVVSVSGQSSYDPDNGPGSLQYAWSIASGPSVPISAANTASATFVPTVPGNYQMSLVVNDGALFSAPASLQVVVPTLGDINLDGSIDSRDLNLILAMLNKPASGPNDLRDLNGDGRIDALDSRKLTTLCSRPRCAVQ